MRVVDSNSHAIAVFNQPPSLKNSNPIPARPVSINRIPTAETIVFKGVSALILAFFAYLLGSFFSGATIMRPLNF